MTYRVLSLRPALALRADSASDQGARGTSGKAARPSQAWCFAPTARRRSASAPVYERHQARGSHRTIGTPEGRLDVAHRTVSGCHLAPASPLCGGDIPDPFAGCSHRIWTGSRGRFGERSRLSSAIGSHGQSIVQDQSRLRTVGSDGGAVRLSSSATNETSICSCPSTISPWRAMVGIRRRKIRSACVVSS